MPFFCYLLPTLRKYREEARNPSCDGLLKTTAYFGQIAGRSFRLTFRRAELPSLRSHESLVRRPLYFCIRSLLAPREILAWSEKGTLAVGARLESLLFKINKHASSLTQLQICRKINSKLGDPVGFLTDRLPKKTGGDRVRFRTRQSAVRK